MGRSGLQRFLKIQTKIERKREKPLGRNEGSGTKSEGLLEVGSVAYKGQFRKGRKSCLHMSAGNEECAFFCLIQKGQMHGDGVQPPQGDGSQGAVQNSAS